MDQLDKILFNDYIKRKSGLLRDIIRQGILLSGVDWYSIPKPTGMQGRDGMSGSMANQLLNRGTSLRV